jgi:hypothetical protein
MSDDTGVVTSTEVAPKKVPKSFNDLKKEDLVKAALAFGADESGNAAEIKADLASLGVTWKMYAQAFKLDGYEALPEEPEEFEMPEPTDVEDWPDAEEGENVSAVVTAAAVPKLDAAEKYLIKFVGENPYFEFGRYKFTQDNPYGIMPATDAQSALVKEPEKFRQAFPAELQEFYG